MIRALLAIAVVVAFASAAANDEPVLNKADGAARGLAVAPPQSRLHRLLSSAKHHGATVARKSHELLQKHEWIPTLASLAISSCSMLPKSFRTYGAPLVDVVLRRLAMTGMVNDKALARSVVLGLAAAGVANHLGEDGFIASAIGLAGSALLSNIPMMDIDPPVSSIKGAAVGAMTGAVVGATLGTVAAKTSPSATLFLVMIATAVSRGIFAPTNDPTGAVGGGVAAATAITKNEASALSAIAAQPIMTSLFLQLLALAGGMGPVPAAAVGVGSHLTLQFAEHLLSYRPINSIAIKNCLILAGQATAQGSSIVETMTTLLVIGGVLQYNKVMAPGTMFKFITNHPVPVFAAADPTTTPADTPDVAQEQAQTSTTPADTPAAAKEQAQTSTTAAVQDQASTSTTPASAE